MSLGQEGVSEGSRELSVLAEKFGVYVCHTIGLERLESSFLTPEATLLDQIQSFLAPKNNKGPRVSASSAGPTIAGGTLRCCMGFVFRGGTVRCGYPRNAFTTPGDKIPASGEVGLSIEAIEYAITHPDGYNELIIDEPEVAGFFLKFDPENDDTEQQRELNKLIAYYMRYFGLPLFFYHETERVLYNGTLDRYGNVRLRDRVTPQEIIDCTPETKESVKEQIRCELACKSKKIYHDPEQVEWLPANQQLPR